MALRLELNREIHALQQSNELTMSEAAYVVAYGLFIQLGEIDGWITTAPFTYENTELVSPFSEKWHNDLADALVEAGNYTISAILFRRFNLRGGWQLLARG